MIHILVLIVNNNEKIINPNITNYYKTIIKVEVPFIIFTGLELANENDLYKDENPNKEESLTKRQLNVIYLLIMINMKYNYLPSNTISIYMTKLDNVTFFELS